jgi:hypothetical protein
MKLHEHALVERAWKHALAALEAPEGEERLNEIHNVIGFLDGAISASNEPECRFVIAGEEFSAGYVGPARNQDLDDPDG